MLKHYRSTQDIEKEITFRESFLKIIETKAERDIQLTKIWRLKDHLDNIHAKNKIKNRGNNITELVKNIDIETCEQKDAREKAEALDLIERVDKEIKAKLNQVSNN